MPTRIEIDAAKKAVADHIGIVPIGAGIETAIEAALTAAESVRATKAADEQQLKLLLGCRTWLWAIVETLDIDPVTSAIELKEPGTAAFDSGPRVSLIDTLAQLDAISERNP